MWKFILPELEKLSKIKFINLFVSGLRLHPTDIDAAVLFFDFELHWTKKIKIQIKYF